MPRELRNLISTELAVVRIVHRRTSHREGRGCAFM